VRACVGFVATSPPPKGPKPVTWKTTAMEADAAVRAYVGRCLKALGLGTKGWVVAPLGGGWVDSGSSSHRAVPGEWVGGGLGGAEHSRKHTFWGVQAHKRLGTLTSRLRSPAAERRGAVAARRYAAGDETLSNGARLARPAPAGGTPGGWGGWCNSPGSAPRGGGGGPRRPHHLLVPSLEALRHRPRPAATQRRAVRRACMRARGRVVVPPPPQDHPPPLHPPPPLPLPPSPLLPSLPHQGRQRCSAAITLGMTWDSQRASAHSAWASTATLHP
jgi:hypothetical protein